MPKHAERFKTLPEYPLAKIPQRKRELIQRGLDVIDLGAGDADLAPPQAVFEALEKAAHDPPMSRYGFGLGLVRFREAVSAWMEKRFGFRVVAFVFVQRCKIVQWCSDIWMLAAERFLFNS